MPAMHYGPSLDCDEQEERLIYPSEVAEYARHVDRTRQYFHDQLMKHPHHPRWMEYEEAVLSAERHLNVMFDDLIGHARGSGC